MLSNNFIKQITEKFNGEVLKQLKDPKSFFYNGFDTIETIQNSTRKVVGVGV